MQLYRLRCDCGADTRVSKGQAGGQVSCGNCDATMQVPNFRELGQLPRVEADTAPTAGSRRLTLRQGLIAGGAVTALLCWGLAAWISSVTQLEFNIGRVREEISRAPFMKVYAAWKELSVADVERDETVGEYRAKNLGRVGKSSATTLAVLGGVGVLIAVGGAVFVRDRSEPAGQSS